MSRPPDRELAKVREELLQLHRDVGTLATAVLRLRPSFRLALFRGRLEDLENRLDTHFGTFMNLDADLAAHADPPSDATTALRNAAQFLMYFGVRDSVRGLLSNTNGMIGSLRNQLDFRSSLMLAVAAIVIALVGAFIALVSAFTDVASFVRGQ